MNKRQRKKAEKVLLNQAWRNLVAWKGPEPDEPCDDLTCRSCYSDGTYDQLFGM